ncbi:MAG: hypothetical protein ACR2KX_07800 [Chitinophagaceae bacterium]
MSKIIVLHFSPLELYPPVQNFLRFFVGKLQGHNIIVLTTGTTVSVLKQFESASDHVSIKRLGQSGQKLNLFKRYLSYFFFNIGSLVYLLLQRPKNIMYYETISSYPVYLYKRFFNSKAKVFIHYHEYTSPQEYNSGMKLTRFFYGREKWLYSHANWVSHTNEYRLQQFLLDVKPFKVAFPQVLPNYPPESWNKFHEYKIDIPVRAVYVGALSMDTMYVKEFTEWVIEQNGKVLWDIYSFNITDDAKKYFQSQRSEWIRLKSGVNYDELPNILKNYEVGIVLYKGHIPNYIYNAPNKLFEYLACDLDVWFPGLMKGSLAYITNKSYPKVLAIDFTKLNQLNLSELIERTSYIYKPGSFFCENILGPFAEKLMAND